MNKPGYKRDPLLPTHNPKQNKRNIKTRYKYLKLTISNTYLNTCRRLITSKVTEQMTKNRM